jgi:hypothetical protein
LDSHPVQKKLKYNIWSSQVAVAEETAADPEVAEVLAVSGLLSLAELV